MYIQMEVTEEKYIFLSTRHILQEISFKTTSHSMFLYQKKLKRQISENGLCGTVNIGA